ncbi:hypothetical protein [Nonomuraea sp. NPDC050202]
MTDAFDPPVVPDDIAQPAMRLADEQDAAHGDWPNPRDGMMPRAALA